MTEEWRGDLLRAGCAALEMELSSRQEEQFAVYVRLLLRWGRRINLTGAASPGEVVRRHVIDSLLLLRVVEVAAGACVADLGSGAGFPGVPLKLMRPDAEIVLIESRRRRAMFLETVVRRLGLDAVRVWIGRAEALAEKSPGSCDLVVVRGIAPEAAWAAGAGLLRPRGRLVCLTSTTVAARAGRAIADARARTAVVRRPFDGMEVAGLVLERTGLRRDEP